MQSFCEMHIFSNELEIYGLVLSQEASYGELVWGNQIHIYDLPETL